MREIGQKPANTVEDRYECGEGVAEDRAEAATWYQRAAEQGEPKAQFLLGRAYHLGKGVARDCAEAIKWYRKAAEQGERLAQLQLGLAYDGGELVAKNYAEAFKWYKMAAEQGQPSAQFQLGLAYDRGEGVAKDCAEAVTWYQKAGDQGDADAQHNLARCYFLGEGVPQDFVEAYKWANLAAAQNRGGSMELRDTLVQKMTPLQIQEGQRQSSFQASKTENQQNRISQDRQARMAIPSNVRREVWRRDGGRCAKCGSRENLEYDHIIPFSKGGSNTARNIELLCETCNRSKRDSIR